MQVVSKYNVQILLATLVFLFSCKQQTGKAQEEKKNEPKQEVTLKPLKAITGEDYREKLFIAIDPISKKMGLLNFNKVEILPMKFDEIYSGFVNPHYVVVYENRGKGLFDLKGKRICESIYDGFLLSPSDSSTIGAYLGSEEKWRIFNGKKERVFAEDYAKIEFLPKGLVLLQKEDLSSSLASISGDLITDFKFQLLQRLDENKAREQWYVEHDIVATAVEGLQTIYINSKGKRVAQ